MPTTHTHNTTHSTTPPPTTDSTPATTQGAREGGGRSQRRHAGRQHCPYTAFSACVSATEDMHSLLWSCHYSVVAIQPCRAATHQQSLHMPVHLLMAKGYPAEGCTGHMHGCRPGAATEYQLPTRKEGSVQELTHPSNGSSWDAQSLGVEDTWIHLAGRAPGQHTNHQQHNGHHPGGKGGWWPQPAQACTASALPLHNRQQHVFRPPKACTACCMVLSVLAPTIQPLVVAPRAVPAECVETQILSSCKAVPITCRPSTTILCHLSCGLLCFAVIASGLVIWLPAGEHMERPEVDAR
jgi:hypothetical protein